MDNNWLFSSISFVSILGFIGIFYTIKTNVARIIIDFRDFSIKFDILQKQVFDSTLQQKVLEEKFISLSKEVENNVCTSKES